ncbi:unnamed protein product [Paramecium sonneborni]|uniref:Uncharacterized protein n=1 Tax=Paramecium sonneborni TaxID=65129 RepID=A0A8S1K1Y8_9CILI|nr:unnamed protein product [Paramecium sonneborni]
MSVTFTLNGQQVKANSSETFRNLFQDYVKQGQFNSKQWLVNGQLIKITIDQKTKISALISENDNVQCQDKGTQAQQSNTFQPLGGQTNNPLGQQPVPSFVQQPVPSFVQQPVSPFNNQQPPFPMNQQTNQPKPSESQILKPTVQQTQAVQQNLAAPANKPFTFGNTQQPIVNIQTQTRKVINDTSGQKETAAKIIKGYKVQITDYGKRVILESQDGSFKATFLEENASEQEQRNIVLGFNDIDQKPENQVKLAMGQDQSQSTKVLFLKDFKGIAIRWVTGLQTKFEFWLDE